MNGKFIPESFLKTICLQLDLTWFVDTFSQVNVLSVHKFSPNFHQSPSKFSYYWCYYTRAGKQWFTQIYLCKSTNLIVLYTVALFHCLSLCVHESVISNVSSHCFLPHRYINTDKCNGLLPTLGTLHLKSMTRGLISSPESC